MEQVVEEILGATLNPEEWPRSLRLMAEFCRADHALVHFVTPAGVNSFASSGSEELFADFIGGGWSNSNTRMRRGLALTRQGVRGVLTDWRCFSPEEIAREPMEQEFAARHRNLHYAGRFTPVGTGPGEADAFVVLTVERGLARGPYVNGELDTVTSLFRILSSSISHARKMGAVAAGGVLEALGEAGKPYARLDGSGRLLHANAPFERLLGAVIHLRHGRVHAADRQDDEKLQWLIWQALCRNEPLPAIRFGDASGPEVRAMPLQGAVRDLTNAHVLLTIEMPKPLPDGDMLRGLYGLTPAETRLSMRLGAGEALRKAAQSEGIAFETARTRLKTIFHKTATNRQVELALLVRNCCKDAV